MFEYKPKFEIGDKVEIQRSYFEARSSKVEFTRAVGTVDAVLPSSDARLGRPWNNFRVRYKLEGSSQSGIVETADIDQIHLDPVRT